MTNTCSVYLTPPAINTLGCVLPLHASTPHPELPSTATSTCYYLRNIMVTSYFENKFTVMNYINYIREHFTRKECCVCECCEVHTNTQTHTCSQARIHTHTHTHTYTHAHTHACSKAMGINHVNVEELMCVKADNTLMSHLNT